MNVERRMDTASHELGRYQSHVVGPAGGGSGLGPERDREGLIDVLDRVLDKGVVIAGDIRINLLDIELLTIKVRLLISSADKARELGMDWWSHDPYFSSRANQQSRDKLDGDREKENKALKERVERLEAQLKALSHDGTGAKATRATGGGAAAGRQKG